MTPLWERQQHGLKVDAVPVWLELVSNFMIPKISVYATTAMTRRPLQRLALA
jgi:hypothetical protein